MPLPSPHGNKNGDSIVVAKHRVPATVETLHTVFDSTLPPVLTAKVDEVFEIQTKDCFSGYVTPTSPDATKVERSQLNPVTGPVYIEGAQPGDWLAVYIHDICPNTDVPGVACCGPHSGQLSHLVKDSTTRFFDVSHDHVSGAGTVTMREMDDDDNGNDRPSGSRRRRVPISFPLRPMLGVIGVAPASGNISTMPAGSHGGILDNHMNGIGATIYLPVSHPGALLSLGDMHASQGDGEISGTGVEVGGRVLLSCRVLKEQDIYGNDRDSNTNKDYRISFPVTETTTHWMTHGVLVEDIPQATNLACEEAAKLLVGQWGFTYEEVFVFLSVRGDLGLCQSCHPDQGTQIARMMVEKLEACPRPFRCLS